MKHATLLITTLLLTAVTTLHAEETVVYKTVGNIELKLFIEKLADWKVERAPHL